MELFKNKEYLENEYLLKGRSTYDLAKEWNVGPSTIYYHLKKNGLIGIKILDKITTVDESKLDIQDPVFCYYAGLVAADGYLQHEFHRVCLRMKKETSYDTLLKIKEYFNASTNIATYDSYGCGYKGSIIQCDFTLSSNKLMEELSILNITHAKKDLTRRFPYMEMLSEECQVMFMRGLFDGDGSIHKGQVSLLEESHEMIEAIVEFIENKLGIEVNVGYRVTDNNKECMYLSIHRNSCRKFLDWLYSCHLDFKLDYKYERYLSL